MVSSLFQLSSILCNESKCIYILLHNSAMDRAWMDALRTSEEYQKGVKEFIEFAKRNVSSKNGKYPCPCVKCVNVDRKSLDSIRNDLICEGINRRYRKWIWHGELGTTVEHVKAAEVNDNDDDDEYVCDVGMDNMIILFNYVAAFGGTVWT